MALDDLDFKMVLDVADEKAITKIDNFTKQIESKLGKTFSRIRINGEKISAKLLTNRSTDKTSYFSQLIKDGNNFIEVIYKVSKETKKLQKITRNILTPKGLAENLGVIDKVKAGIEEKESIFGGEFDKSFSDQQTKIDKVRGKIVKLKEEIKDLRRQYILARDSGDNDRAQGILGTTTSKYREMKSQEKTLGKLTKSGFGKKIFGTFVSAVLRRLAYKLLNVIEQGLQEGTKMLARFNSEFRKTMDQMTSYSEMIKGSIALIVAPFKQMLAPIVKEIAFAFSDIADSVSRMNSAFQGLTKYTKINRDYLRQFEESANSALLSFDKFESLSGESNPYEEAQMTPEQLKEAKEWAEVWQAVKDLIVGIWNVLKKVFLVVGKIIISLLPVIEPLLNLVSLVIDRLMPFIDDILNAVSSVAEQIGGVLKFIGAIISLLLGDFDSALKNVANGFAEFINGIVNFFVDIINFFISNLNFILKPLDSIIKLLGGNGISIPKIQWRMNWQPYANGGVPDRGSLFVAGESGAELVHTMSSGQTGVTNIAQFKQAMVEALYEASGIFGDSSAPIVLNLDGAEIARSKRFKQELNKTNSGLNLK